jgi:hypothetical protein
VIEHPLHRFERTSLLIIRVPSVCRNRVTRAGWPVASQMPQARIHRCG